MRYPLIPENQRRCLGGDTFGAAGKTEVLGGGGLHAYPADVDAEVGGNVGAHLRNVGQHLGLLSDDGNIYIDRNEAFSGYNLYDLPQEDARIRPAPALVRVREMPAYVAQSRGAEKCVGERVKRHIGIAMTEQPELMGNIDAADYATASFDELMHIEAITYTEVGNPSHILAALAEDVAETVEVERKSEAQGLVQRRGLGGGHHVGRIEANHVQRKTGAKSEILAVALVFVLVVVAGTQEELVVVGILGTKRHGNFAELFLGAAWSVGKALKNTGDGAHVAPVLQFGDVLLFTLYTLGKIAAARLGGHQQLVEVERKSKGMVVGQGEHEGRAESQVRRQEVGHVAAVVADFCTDIRDVPAP